MFAIHHPDTFLQISKDYIACVIPKCGCSTITLQSICYHEHKNIYDYREYEGKHISSKGEHFFDCSKNHYTINEKYLPENHKIIAIFRDPIERYISTWHTSAAQKLCNDFNLNLIKLCSYIGSDEKIDQHYTPQHMYYDFKNIDIFIELKDYHKFCEEHNIPWIITNKNASSYYDKFRLSENNIRIIKSIYDKDYRLIDEIKKSNKLYIPK